jgi:hypothetical protein
MLRRSDPSRFETKMSVSPLSVRKENAIRRPSGESEGELVKVLNTGKGRRVPSMKE